jgi:Protein of unknown function (DUF4238)
MKSPTKPQKKRHHYIPVAYLNAFTDEGGRLVAYRKDEPQKPLTVRPSEIAFERYYYSQPLPEGGQDNNTIEDGFSEIESTWPPIVDRMRAGADVNSDLEAIFMFLALMRVRVPATRDMVELSLAESVKSSIRAMGRAGQLPPPPAGFENLGDVLDWAEIAIDPHQSIHAMATLANGLVPVVDRLGLQVVHNETDETFITTDNPVTYFDPDIPEQGLRPYTVDPVKGRIELLFPVGPQTLIRGHSDLKPRFAREGAHHIRVTSRQEIKRMNRLIARFGYRFIFAASRAHERLIVKHASLSPVIRSTAIPSDDGEYLLGEYVFGKRRSKPKWRGARE